MRGPGIGLPASAPMLETRPETGRSNAWNLQAWNLQALEPPNQADRWLRQVGEIVAGQLNFDRAPISASTFQISAALRSGINPYRDSSPFRFMSSETGPASPIFSATDFAWVNSSR